MHTTVRSSFVPRKTDCSAVFAFSVLVQLKANVGGSRKSQESQNLEIQLSWNPRILAGPKVQEGEGEPLRKGSGGEDVTLGLPKGSGTTVRLGFVPRKTDCSLVFAFKVLAYLGFVPRNTDCSAVFTLRDSA